MTLSKNNPIKSFHNRQQKPVFKKKQTKKTGLWRTKERNMCQRISNLNVVEGLKDPQKEHQLIGIVANL